MITWIHEGDRIPNGLWIKTGLFYPQEQWKTAIEVTYGKDGLVESVVSGLRPTGTHAGVWMTFGVRFGPIKFSVRFKDWTKQVIWHLDCKVF